MVDLPQPGQVVDMGPRSDGEFRYIVLAQHGAVDSGWCKCDLINVRTRKVFYSHVWTERYSVKEPTDEECALFAALALKPEIGRPA
jgi:hypothetical protein